MTMSDPRPVLVAGAMGGQGGSAAIETLKKGIGVRALAAAILGDEAKPRADRLRRGSRRKGLALQENPAAGARS